MTNKELIHKWSGYKELIIYPTGEVETLIDETIKALERKEKYRAEARRFKRKYLLLKDKISKQGGGE